MLRKHKPLESRKPTRPKRITGGVIQCHDCGKLGHIAFPDGLTPNLPLGWRMAWVGLRQLYTCPECGRKRREAILRNIERR